MSLDVEAIRAQFPILSEREVVYLDSGASAQKPAVVLEAIDDYYRRHHANVHRGVHILSQEATAAYEAGREACRRFLHAPSAAEVVFTRGTTEALNLVASSWGGANLKPGDEVVLTELEHHSNIVPWQLVAARTGAVIKVAPVLDDGSLDLERFEALLSERTKMVAAVHVSNAIGTVLPVARMVALAHAVGAVVLLDGAQAAVHLPVDVQALGCDFYVFSGHKVYGPTGIGVLWGREALLEAMPPYQGGGEMIAEVQWGGSTWAELPAKFEAGTPHIAGAVGLGVAVDWLRGLGATQVAAWEDELLRHGTQVLSEVPGLRMIGTSPHKAGVLSFVIEGIHPQDIGTLLDEQGVAVRTGHHCAQPAMRRFQVSATTRASLGVYNTPQELDQLGAGLRRVVRMFG